MLIVRFVMFIVFLLNIKMYGIIKIINFGVLYSISINVKMFFIIMGVMIWVYGNSVLCMIVWVIFCICIIIREG